MHRRVQGTLWSYAIADDVDAVRELCAYTASGRARGVQGAHGSRSILQPTLPDEPMLDIDAADDAGRTALHYGVLLNHVAVVEALLEAGAHCNSTDIDFCTPLHLAAADAHDEVALLLIANEASLDMRSLVEQTPMLAALTSRSRDSEAIMRIVEAMLVYGADANEVDIDGLHPIHHVALRNFSRCVGALVQHGADVNALARLAPPFDDGAASVPPATKAPDRLFSALHISAGIAVPSSLLVHYDDAPEEEEGPTKGSMPRDVDAETLVALLQHGAQPNARASPGADTPLHVVLRAMTALKSEHFSPAGSDSAVVARERFASYLAAAVRLASFGARLDDVKDASGSTPAELASALGLGPPLEISLQEYRAGVASPAEAANAASILSLRHAARLRGGSGHGVSGSPSSASPRARASTGGGGGGLLGKLQLLGRSQWVPDAAAGACSTCDSPFSLLNRRHHCRACGGLVCAACSMKQFPLLLVSSGEDGPDSDDDEGGASSSSGSRPASSRLGASFTAALRSALATPDSTAAATASGAAATSSPLKGSQQPSSGTAQSPSASSRVCDGCFNYLSHQACLAAAETAVSGAAAAAVSGAVAAGASAASTGGKKPIAFEAFTASKSARQPQPTASTSAASTTSTSTREQLLGERLAKHKADRAAASAAVSDSASRSSAGVKASLEDAREKLGQRGERLSHLGERTAEMASDAEEFASLSAQLKKKYEPTKLGFLGF